VKGAPLREERDGAREKGKGRSASGGRVLRGGEREIAVELLGDSAGVRVGQHDQQKGGGRRRCRVEKREEKASVMRVARQRANVPVPELASVEGVKIAASSRRQEARQGRISGESILG